MHLIAITSPEHQGDTDASMLAMFEKEEGRRRSATITMPPIESRKVHPRDERSIIRIIRDAPADAMIIAAGWDVFQGQARKLKDVLTERQHHGVLLVCLRPYFKLDPQAEDTWINLFFLTAAHDEKKLEKRAAAREAYRREAKEETTERVLKAYLREGLKVPAIADRMQISESTIRRILQKNTKVGPQATRRKPGDRSLPTSRRYDPKKIDALPVEKGSVLHTAIQSYLMAMRSDRTRLVTLQSLKRFFGWFHGLKKKEPAHPDDITITDMQNYKGNLEENVAKSTTATHLYHLQGLFRHAMLSAATQKTPFAVIKIPIYEKDRVTYEPFTREEIQLLTMRLEFELKAAQDSAEYDLSARMNMGITLFRATGGRALSILNIKLCDITFKKDRVLVRLYLKGGRELVVTLGPKMAEALRQYIAVVFKGKEDPDFFLMFHSAERKFEPVSYEKFRLELLALGKRAGIKSRVTSHRFRASFATHNQEDGMEEHEIQTRMGHKKRDQTRRYFVLMQKPFDPAV